MKKFTPLRSEFYKLFLSMSFYGKFRPFFYNSETRLSKQFFSQFDFFFALSSMIFRNICKLCHKLQNAKNLPELTWSWENKPWWCHPYMLCWPAGLKQVTDVTMSHISHFKCLRKNVSHHISHVTCHYVTIKWCRPERVEEAWEGWPMHKSFSHSWMHRAQLIVSQIELVKWII